jgi:hypothetical protein
VACNSKKPTSKTTSQALSNEISEKWATSDVLIDDLAKNYRLLILDYPTRLNDGTMADSARWGAAYNWRRLSLASRTEAKQKLAQLVTSMSRLIEIDARKGSAVTNMEKVQSRYRGAIAFQNSLNLFEKTYGETMDPQGTSNERIYSAPIEN